MVIEQTLTTKVSINTIVNRPLTSNVCSVNVNTENHKNDYIRFEGTTYSNVPV